MATIYRGYSFGATEQVTAAKLHALVDSATILSIVNSEITDNTIQDAKIASVSGSKLITLSGTPSGAGRLPQANIPTSITQTTQFTDVNIDGGVIDGVTMGDSVQVVATNIDVNGGTVDATNIGATTPGTGAFTTLKVGTTNQGDVLYDNGTSLVRLIPGTSGQFLKTQGTSANPTWAGVGSLLVSNTTMTSATNSGDIAITQGSYYMVIINIKTATTQDVGVQLIFNNDTGNHYGNIGESRTTSAAIVINPTPGGAVDDLDQEGFLTCRLLLSPVITDQMSVVGEGIFINPSHQVYSTEVYGAWNNNEAVTSFEIATSNVVTGNILLYRFSTS